MASDIFYDEYAVNEFDIKLNGDIFITGGIMDPKELYLQDLTQCQDTSSSDSGISTVDDLQDIANITDLNSILDTDFSLEYILPKFDQDFFDPDTLIKSEPPSPALCCKQDITFYDDVTSKDEGSPLTLTGFGWMDDSSSPASSPNSPQQLYTVQSSPESLCPRYESSSPTLMFNSQTLQIGPAFSSSSAGFTYNHSLLLNSLPDIPSSVYTVDSPLSASTPPASPPSIIILPSIKKENKISILPSPRGLLVSSSGDVKPTTTTAAAVNIDSILNSKVKIKPKPGSEVISTAGNTQWVTTTASSPMSFPGHQPFPIITTSSVISGGSITTVTDERTLKKAQRVIKNRESASLSRKRKKEYMTSLEQRLQECQDENERLLKENEALRQRLDSLQRENTGLKYPNMSPAKKICLMCLGFLLVLNLSPFSLMNGSTSSSSGLGINPNYHVTGRHLLSAQDEKISQTSEYNNGGAPTDKDMWSPSMLMQFSEELNLLAEKLNITKKLGNMCPMYFNSTESNRLAEQLRRWMISQEEEKKKTERKQQKKKKDYPPLRRFGTGIFSGLPQPAPSSEIHRPTVTEHNYPVQLFSAGIDPRQQLLNAIHRRNDTFYVLSFSTDYFLVPATAHNKTMRPRMSLLMPVVTPSVIETTSRAQDSIGMMQIDCEILNTNIIKVHRSVVPEDPHYNSTSYEKNNSSSIVSGEK